MVKNTRLSCHPDLVEAVRIAAQVLRGPDRLRVSGLRRSCPTTAEDNTRRIIWWAGAIRKDLPRPVSGQTDGQLNKRTYKQKDRMTEKQKYWNTERQKDRKTEKQWHKEIKLERQRDWESKYI